MYTRNRSRYRAFSHSQVARMTEASQKVTRGHSATFSRTTWAKTRTWNRTKVVPDLHNKFRRYSLRRLCWSEKIQDIFLPFPSNFIISLSYLHYKVRTVSLAFLYDNEIIELEFSDKNNEQDSSQSAGIFKLTFMPIKIKTSKKL